MSIRNLLNAFHSAQFKSFKTCMWYSLIHGALTACLVVYDLLLCGAAYVGLATVAGFIWWYVYSDSGPKLPYSELVGFIFFSFFPFLVSKVFLAGFFKLEDSLAHFLQMNFDSCSTRETTYPCSIFEDRHPSTVSMTVLVVVEMFNALNNLSENQSLL